MPEYATLDTELAEAQYALNRAMGRMLSDDYGYADLLVARDLVWSHRQYLNPELRG